MTCRALSAELEGEKEVHVYENVDVGDAQSVSAFAAKTKGKGFKYVIHNSGVADWTANGAHVGSTMKEEGG